VTQKSVSVNGYIRAVANQNHPLQTQLSLIITDFAPNGNKQGIPETEKQNIIQYAKNMPLKINFDGAGYAGHTGAIPVGPIVNVYESEDNGRPIIAGDAIIWNEVYEDIAEHLKVAFSEGIGTSWEIFYESSQTDSDGNQWLHGCVFAGTCVVQVPAYGPNRTRVLAIAEKLQQREEQLLEMTQTMSIEKNPAQADDLTSTRNDLSEVSDILFKLWEGVDSLFNKTFEIEQATVETDIGKIAESFAEKLGKIADRINDMTSKLGLSEQAQAELKTQLDQLKREKEEAEAATVKEARKSKLHEAGIDEEAFEAKAEMYLGMSDEMFDTYVNDLQSVRNKPTAKAEAQQKPRIPEPLSSSDTELTTQELAAEFRKVTRR
jgi:hypothetical protein